MNLFEAIEKRHSYRGKFKNQPVPRSDLEKIVTAGIRAPSAKNEQVVSFVAVDDRQLLDKISAIFPDRPVCVTAQAMIICLTDNRPVLNEFSFAAEDCSAAVENMLLAITALGYATVWLDGVLRYENRATRIGEMIGAPQDRSIRILLPLGVPEEQVSQREKLPFNQRAWFNHWGKEKKM